jgi:hypothetical protein
MVSTQNKQMTQFFASMTERMSRTDLDLETIRDVYENLHLAAREPEGVCYAEVDINGVPALWCVPKDCDVDRVLLHAHGGTELEWHSHPIPSAAYIVAGELTLERKERWEKAASYCRTGSFGDR